MTNEELRVQAIWILGNLIHYRNSGSHYEDDIQFLINALREIDTKRV